MTDAGPPRKAAHLRIVSFLRHTLFRSRDAPRATDSAERGPFLELRELAIAQFVHDLRNQLTVVAACADELEAFLRPGRGEAGIAQLRESARRSSALARDLLVAARPRVADRVPIDLNEIVATTAATLSRMRVRGLRLHLSLSVEPVVVSAEAIELERIVLNLALNARDAIVDVDSPATHTGGLEHAGGRPHGAADSRRGIYFRTKPRLPRVRDVEAGEGGLLTIETAIVNDRPPSHTAGTLTPRARLTVRDTGRGMAPDVQARMFEPFFTTRQGGTGLGLSSVAFTVAQLRGTIEVDSQPALGTTVVIHLPLAR